MTTPYWVMPEALLSMKKDSPMSFKKVYRLRMNGRHTLVNDISDWSIRRIIHSFDTKTVDRTGDSVTTDRNIADGLVTGNGSNRNSVPLRTYLMWDAWVVLPNIGHTSWTSLEGFHRQFANVKWEVYYPRYSRIRCCSQNWWPAQELLDTI